MAETNYTVNTQQKLNFFLLKQKSWKNRETSYLYTSSVVVDWRRTRRLPSDDPSAANVRSPPHSPSGLRCGRESRRPRSLDDPDEAASSAAESGDSESRCVCSAAISEAAGRASGDRKGRDPRLPVLPPVGIPINRRSIECNWVIYDWVWIDWDNLGFQVCWNSIDDLIRL